MAIGGPRREQRHEARQDRYPFKNVGTARKGDSEIFQGFARIAISAAGERDLEGPFCL
jgi:hypothetical protein